MLAHHHSRYPNTNTSHQYTIEATTQTEPLPTISLSLISLRDWELRLLAHIKVKGMENFDHDSGSTTPDPRSWVELEDVQNQAAELYGGESVRQGVPSPRSRQARRAASFSFFLLSRISLPTTYAPLTA
jgi:hypothetical protein